MNTKQEQLNEACKNASGAGVGWLGTVNKDNTVTLRREEIYSISKESNYTSLNAALMRLALAQD